MTPLSDFRSYRNFGSKAKGLSILHDTKPGGFYNGWTVQLIINGNTVVSCFSKPTLREAMDELRYKLSKVGLISGMARGNTWRDILSTGSQSFSTDFRGHGVVCWWCRKTLHQDKEARPELRVHLEICNRNLRGQWQKREPNVELHIFGRTIKEIKTTWQALTKYSGNYA